MGYEGADCTFKFIFHAFHKVIKLFKVFLQLDEPLSCGGSCCRIRESRRGASARYNATLDLVPYAKSQCGGWNATAHARRSFHSVAGPMGREGAKRNGILPTGTFVDGR